jgi:hypothetical protein
VVVGDGQSIYDKLAAIAPTRIIDADGSSLTPDDLNPAVTALELDLTHLAARRDSFQIAFQGNAIGHAVSALVTEGDALMYWEQTVIPMMGMTQETSVELNPSTFTSRSVDIVGSFGGRPIETHIVYQDGRVSGRAQDIQPTGEIATVDVDTSIVAGTIDLNLIQPLLPFLSLQPGASFTVNAFDAGSNVVRVVTLKVTGTEEVTVPAGTFSAFRITLSGLEQSAIYFVSTDIPHRVVKTELVGQPVSFELVQMQ